MLNWLRRRFGLGERRWIPGSEERDRHEAVVRERLSDPDSRATDAPVGEAPAAPDHDAEPRGR